MKKLLITLICLVTTSIINGQDLPVEEIVSRYLKTIGQEKLMKMETSKIMGKVIQQGLEMPYIMIQKKPEKLWQEIEAQGMKVVVSFDGVNGWLINPMLGTEEAQDMDAESIKTIRKSYLFDPTIHCGNPFVNWKENGTKIELAGKEDFEGTQVYNLKFTFEDGYIVNYFVDASGFVLRKTKSTETIQGQSFDREARFSDHKDYDGILLPGKMELFINGQSGQMQTIENCELNIPVNDSIFIKPIKKQN